MWARKRPGRKRQVLSFRADVDLERILHSFFKKAQCKGNSWELRKSNLICPWRIHRDGIFTCVLSYPGERPEGEGLCLGVGWGSVSSSSLYPGLCGHLPGFLSFAAGRAGSWPCSLRELGSSTPLSGLGAGGVRGAAACAQSWRPSAQWARDPWATLRRTMAHSKYKAPAPCPAARALPDPGSTGREGLWL